MNKTYDHQEKQYLAIVKEICLTGHKIEGRNGFTYSKHGACMSFSLENNTLPILTTKKVALKTCLKELFWFLSGSTNNDVLNRQKCSYLGSTRRNLQRFRTHLWTSMETL